MLNLQNGEEFSNSLKIMRVWMGYLTEDLKMLFAQSVIQRIEGISYVDDCGK